MQKMLYLNILILMKILQNTSNLITMVFLSNVKFVPNHTFSNGVWKITWKIVHEKISYKCNLCSKSFTNKRYAAEHTATEHHKDGKIKCGVCDKTFTIIQQLKRHKYKVHNVKIHFCNFCSNVYKSKDALEYHKDMKHKTKLVTSIFF